MSESMPTDDHRLDAWLRGELDAEEARLFVDAARGDERQREEVDAYAEMIEAIGALDPEPAPDRDLWPVIAAQVEARPRHRVRPLVGFGVAAGILLAAGLAFLRPSPPTPSSPSHQAASVPRPAPMLTGYTATTDGLDAIQESLRAEVTRRSRALPPEVRESIFQNLATIDRAIAEIELAIGRNPGDLELARTYIDYRHRQIDFLRRVNQRTGRL